MVTIRIPALPRGMFSNLLGLAGLVAVTVAVGGLTRDWWWSVLVGGVFAVALSYIAHMNAAQVERAAVESPTRELPRLAPRSA